MRPWRTGAPAEMAALVRRAKAVSVKLRQLSDSVLTEAHKFTNQSSLVTKSRVAHRTLSGAPASQFLLTNVVSRSKGSCIADFHSVRPLWPPPNRKDLSGCSL